MADFYAIVLLVDTRINSTTARSAKDKVNTIIDFVQIIEDTFTQILLVADTNINIDFYMGVANDVEQGIKDVISDSVSNQGMHLPYCRTMWFGNEGWTYDTMKARLISWLKENPHGIKKYWVIDYDTDLTGDILTKFVDL